MHTSITFSRDACAENAERMTQDYLAALSELEENPELTVDEVTQPHNLNIKWDRELKNNLKRKKKTEFEEVTSEKLPTDHLLPQIVTLIIHFHK